MGWETATSDLVSVRVPPCAVDDARAGGQGVVPSEADGAEEAAGEVVQLEGGDGNTVDGVDARGGDGEQLWRRGDGGLRVQQGFDAGDLGVGDVDEEDVGMLGAAEMFISWTASFCTR